MISVTSTAADKLKEIMVEEGQPSGALRVIVVPNEHGAQYMMAIEEEAKVDDLVVHENGIRVLVDSESVALLEGAEIDYTEGLMRSGFVINNPNIMPSGGGCACGGNCGCGGG
jgi:iron-sulfur cluster assembly accessory protein